MTHTDLRQEFMMKTGEYPHMNKISPFCKKYGYWLESELLRLRKENEWIDAEETQPDSSRDVLVLYGGAKRTFTGYYESECWLVYQMDDDMPEPTDSVTEWRELPSREGQNG